MKILCEAGGIGLSFLKTAEIEQPVYLEVRENTIKAPPVATGAIESIGMIVTDITSLVCTINDLVTDKEVRKKAKDGFIEVGNQVKNDPKQLLPILKEVLVEEVTGSSSDQLAEIQLETTDAGRKVHLVSKAGVSTVKAVIVGGKFISELPEIAMKLAAKMTKAKSMLKFKNIDNLAKHLVEEFTAKLKNLPDGGKKFLDDFKDASEDIRRKFLEKPELVESWEVLEESAELRGNVDALETVSYYTKNVNSNVDEVTNSFKAASNKEDWFSEKITEIRSKARNLPGTTKGSGVKIEGKWMRGTDGNIGLFPKRIANKLKGKNFNSFAEFRSEFWKAVADDPEFFEQFGRSGQSEMLKGNAPFTKVSQQVGKKKKYEIHHKTPIHDGGEVYDMDNLVIVTPRYHKEILDPAYHFKR